MLEGLGEGGREGFWRVFQVLLVYQTLAGPIIVTFAGFIYTSEWLDPPAAAAGARAGKGGAAAHRGVAPGYNDGAR